MHSPKPWYFGKNLVSSTLFLRVPRIFCFQRFLEKVPKMAANLFALSAQAGIEVFPGSFRWYFLLFPYLPDPSTTLSLQQSRLFYSLCGNYPKFSEGLLRDFKQCLRKSSLCLLFLPSLYGGALLGISSFFYDRLFFRAVFPLII